MAVFRLLPTLLMIMPDMLLMFNIPVKLNMTTSQHTNPLTQHQHTRHQHTQPLLTKCQHTMHLHIPLPHTRPQPTGQNIKRSPFYRLWWIYFYTIIDNKNYKNKYDVLLTILFFLWSNASCFRLLWFRSNKFRNTKLWELGYFFFDIAIIAFKIWCCSFKIWEVLKFRFQKILFFFWSTIENKQEYSF